jgi:hypothetical protein
MRDEARLTGKKKRSGLTEEEMKGGSWGEELLWGILG